MSDFNEQKDSEPAKNTNANNDLLTDYVRPVRLTASLKKFVHKQIDRLNHEQLLNDIKSRWKHLSLEEKACVVKTLRARSFSVQDLGDSIFVAPRAHQPFYLEDPNSNNMPVRYRQLNDPALQRRVLLSSNKAKYKRFGQITHNGEPSCSVKEYRQYFQYIRSVENHRIREEELRSGSCQHCPIVKDETFPLRTTALDLTEIDKLKKKELMDLYSWMQRVSCVVIKERETRRRLKKLQLEREETRLCKFLKKFASSVKRQALINQTNVYPGSGAFDKKKFFGQPSSDLNIPNPPSLYKAPSITGLSDELSAVLIPGTQKAVKVQQHNRRFKREPRKEFQAGPPANDVPNLFNLALEPSLSAEEIEDDDDDDNPCFNDDLEERLERQAKNRKLAEKKRQERARKMKMGGGKKDNKSFKNPREKEFQLLKEIAAGFVTWTIQGVTDIILPLCSKMPDNKQMTICDILNKKVKLCHSSAELKSNNPRAFSPISPSDTVVGGGSLTSDLVTQSLGPSPLPDINEYQHLSARLLLTTFCLLTDEHYWHMLQDILQKADTEWKENDWKDVSILVIFPIIRQTFCHIVRKMHKTSKKIHQPNIWVSLEEKLVGFAKQESSAFHASNEKDFVVNCIGSFISKKDSKQCLMHAMDEKESEVGKMKLLGFFDQTIHKSDEETWDIIDECINNLFSHVPSNVDPLEDRKILLDDKRICTCSKEDLMKILKTTGRNNENFVVEENNINNSAQIQRHSLSSKKLKGISYSNLLMKKHKRHSSVVVVEDKFVNFKIQAPKSKSYSALNVDDENRNNNGRQGAGLDGILKKSNSASKQNVYNPLSKARIYPLDYPYRLKYSNIDLFNKQHKLKPISKKVKEHKEDEKKTFDKAAIDNIVKRISKIDFNKNSTNTDGKNNDEFEEERRNNDKEEIVSVILPPIKNTLKEGGEEEEEKVKETLEESTTMEENLRLQINGTELLVDSEEIDKNFDTISIRSSNKKNQHSLRRCNAYTNLLRPDLMNNERALKAFNKQNSPRPILDNNENNIDKI